MPECQELPQQFFYAAASKDCRFSLRALQRKRCDVLISRSEQIYSGTAIKRVGMYEVDEGMGAAAPARLRAWVVKNPDQTYWWDSLEDTKAQSQAWMGQANDDALAPRGAAVVCVEFAIV